MPNDKKALGIDFGLKRIGLSLSDDTMTVAFPFKYIINESLKKTILLLSKIISEENIGLIVVGMPIGLKGKQTEISLKINELISELKKATENGPEITVYDERFSSVQAQKSLIEQNIKRKKKKEKIDSVASSFILQSYLDRQKQRKEIF